MAPGFATKDAFVNGCTRKKFVVVQVYRPLSLKSYGSVGADSGAKSDK